MKTLEQLLKERKDLEKRIHDLNMSLREVKQKMADLSCPVKVGDNIRFVPRSRNRRASADKFLVSGVMICDWNIAGVFYQLRGRKLRKDDTPGVREQEILRQYGKPIKI